MFAKFVNTRTHSTFVIEVDCFEWNIQLLGYLIKCVIAEHVNLQGSTGVLALNVDTL
jgi:hypothetical protein